MKKPPTLNAQNIPILRNCKIKYTLNKVMKDSPDF